MQPLYLNYRSIYNTYKKKSLEHKQSLTKVTSCSSNSLSGHSSPVFPMQQTKWYLIIFWSSSALHSTFLNPPLGAKMHCYTHSAPRLLNIHLHAAVSHRHGIVSQSITGHLAVIGAADGGERAHMTGVEWVSSLVRSGEVTTGITLILMQQGNRIQQVDDTPFLLCKKSGVSLVILR